MKRLGLPDSEQPVWYHVLLATLLAALVARPVADFVGWGDRLLSFVGVLLLLSCVMAMGKARASRLVAWVVLVPASVLTVVFRERFAELHILGQGLGAVLMLMVCWRILRRVFTTRDVTWGTISGALAVFLLFSVLWAMLYGMAAWSVDMEPAFHGLPQASELRAALDAQHVRAEVESLLSYFSLVTQTTLGYGDVYPTHAVTRALATSQAVVGQLYLVVLVARLVSVHAQSTPDDAT